jgi:hypothetical protein
VEKIIQAHPFVLNVILVGVHFALMEIARVLLGEAKWLRVDLDEILAKLARKVVRENYKEFKSDH